LIEWRGRTIRLCDYLITWLPDYPTPPYESEASMYCGAPRSCATIGPASHDPAMLAQLIEAGMDVARLNFSHGDEQYHRESIQHIRELAER